MSTLPEKTQIALTLGGNYAHASMTSLDISELTGSRHDSVKRTIERLAESCVISLPPLVEVKVQRERRAEAVEAYVFTGDKGRRDSIIAVAQLCPEFTARIVDRWHELEAKVAAPTALSRMDILKLAMESEEARIKAEAERDHAIATKAQIGGRREATAMATAAAAKREAARLKDQLGFSARHATILQVEDATGEDYDFVPLRRWCKAHEVTPETVPDKRYPKGVKAWPAAAWMDVYGVDLGALFSKDAGTFGGDAYAMGDGV